MCIIEEEDTPGPATMRRTGDWVRIAPPGSMYYMGRMDQQVKRHGKRFNLTDVEKVGKSPRCLEMFYFLLGTWNIYFSIIVYDKAIK